MNGYNSLELVVLPQITYAMVEHNVPINRRIYTDGREWPREVDPTFQGYSIGKWIDSDGVPGVHVEHHAVDAVLGARVGVRDNLGPDRIFRRFVSRALGAS